MPPIDPDAPWAWEVVLIAVAIVIPAISAIYAARANARSKSVDQLTVQRQTDHARIRALEERTDALEEGRRRDNLTIRALGDHIDVLEAHIWAGSPPPPPTRPPL